MKYDQQFAEAVAEGLSKSLKSIPSVYFYDARGSQLFEEICDLPEYYCTRAEGSILRDRAKEIADQTSEPVQVVELGSGSSIKTRWLLDALLKARESVIYRPIDVSREILTETATRLKEIYPRLSIQPIAAQYDEALPEVDMDEGHILLLWLGSSIGNFGRKEAQSFLSGLSSQLTTGDLMLIGIDLVKDITVLEAAYNDASGVTAAFNLNLLIRINSELGGTFDLEQFQHVAFYNQEEDRIEMHLESLCEQTVSIAALDMKVDFSKGERIHTENSHKYSLEHIEALAEGSGLREMKQWFDRDRRFSLNLFMVDND